jgi:hypothetical protein
MNLAKLLHWLEQHKVDAIEDRTHADGTRVIILSGRLPFPIHEREHVWYPLVIRKGQMDVSEWEVETILRRFWHLELEVPPEYPTV